MKTNNVFLERLYEEKIDYFSFSVLKKGVPIISYCNNKEWLDFYNTDYGVYKEPPVQKYITSTTLRLLVWDLCDVTKDTSEYISKRNEVVGVCSNLTLIRKKKEFITAVTFGTKFDKSFVIDFLNKNSEFIIKAENSLF